MAYTDADIAQLDSQSGNSSAPVKSTYTDADISAMDAGGSKDTRKPFYDAVGMNLTPEQKIKDPMSAGLEQTAQDIGTSAYKILNVGGVLDKGLKMANIAPPNFDNTAPENKSGLNLISDIGNLETGGAVLGKIAKVATPAVKAVGKAIPEGLKQSSYALMQSIVNQLPKEFKYGANAGRAMVKEKLQGDASDIAEQSAAKIKEIGPQGDALASASNKQVNNNNAIKVIDDKIAELQKNAPRENANTINRLQNAKKDLLGVVEDDKGIVTDAGTNTSNMTPKETLDFKRKYDYLTQWKGTASDDSIVNSTLQASRRAVKDNLNDAVPEMKEWNQRYSDLAAANQAAARRVSYDQAGSGMRNILNNFVRGSVGVTTVGAILTGNGHLAGEVLAGWGAKEVLGNPMVKSKVAQMLYNMSEADKSAVFKVVPWIKAQFANLSKGPQYDKVDAELVNNGIPQNNGPKIGMDSKPGLPAPQVQTPNPYTKGLPSPRQSFGQVANPEVIQGGPSKPLGLPDSSIQMGPTTRSGVDRPWENRGLPSPKNVGVDQTGAGATINQGTSYKAPVQPVVNTPPKYGGPNTFSGKLYERDVNAQGNPLHPAREGKAYGEQPHPDKKIADNMGVAPNDVERLRNIKGMLENSEKGGSTFSSYKGGNQGERTNWSNKSTLPDDLKSRYSQQDIAKMLDNKLNGGTVHKVQKNVIKKLLDYYSEGKKVAPSQGEWTD